MKYIESIQKSTDNRWVIRGVIGKRVYDTSQREAIRLYQIAAEIQSKKGVDYLVLSAIMYYRT